MLRNIFQCIESIPNVNSTWIMNILLNYHWLISKINTKLKYCQKSIFQILSFLLLKHFKNLQFKQVWRSIWWAFWVVRANPIISENRIWKGRYRIEPKTLTACSTIKISKYDLDTESRSESSPSHCFATCVKIVSIDDLDLDTSQTH